MVRLKKPSSSADQVGMRLLSTTLVGLLGIGLVAGACGGGSEFVLDEESTPDPNHDPSNFESVDGSLSEVSDEKGYLELDHEADALNASLDRADLRLDSSVVAEDGVFEVTASMASLDTSSILGPVIAVELAEGVVATSVPALCESVDGMLECGLEPFFTPGTFPHSSESIVLTFTVEPGAVGQRVTLVATSDGNPVSNDPDPTNNTVVHELS